MRTRKQFIAFALVAIIVLAFTACPPEPKPEPQHVHQWGAWTVTTPATCIAKGVETRVCTLNATHKETQDIPIDPTAHIWGSWSVTTAPTCTATGVGSRICTLSSAHTESNGVIPALGHDSGEWHTTLAATCTATGTRQLRCTRDDAVLNTETVAALGHDYQNWTQTTAPTCTTAGVETGTCTHDPTHTTTRAVAALGHDWGEWVSTATFITAGVETRTCAHDSSHTETRAVDPLLIKTADDWNTALTQLNEKTGSYTLTVSGDIGVAGTYPNTFGTTANGSALSVTLRGSGKLYLTSRGSILRIGANQTLVIDSANLTLQGFANGQNGATQDNDCPAVYVGSYPGGGTLELKNGTVTGNAISNISYGGAGVYVFYGGIFTMSGGKISGNKTDSRSTFTSAVGGGGVYVYSNGTFTMTGGEISGNTTDYRGGGVAIAGGTFTMSGGTISGNISSSSSGGGVAMTNNNATFTMYGGIISGNTAAGDGGGVYVSSSNATFIMNGGTISGNKCNYSGGGVYVYGTFRIVTGTVYGNTETDTALRNTAPTGGAALQMTSDSYAAGIAQYGTFTDDTWISAGDLSTTSNTIKVANGMLQ